MTKQTGRYDKHRFFISSIVAPALLLGMLNLALPLRLVTPVRAESSVAMPADLGLRSESQLKSEALLFQTALNAIAAIATMRLTTPEELAAANAIVEKNIANLRFARSKLIVMGFADSTFTSAVKRKGADKAATEAFGIELAKDPTSIFKVSGGQALGDRMRSVLAADTAKITQVVAVLKKASADLKAKQGHHASLSNSTLASTVITSPTPAEMSTLDIAFLVVVVAVIVFPPLGLVLISLVASVAVVGVAALAATLIRNLAKNATTDEGRDEVAECTAAVDRKYRGCIDAAKDDGLFAYASAALCYADWLAAAAACWVS